MGEKLIRTFQGGIKNLEINKGHIDKGQGFGWRL